MIDSQRMASMSDVPLEVVAGIGARPMLVSEVLSLRVGSIIATSQRAGANLDVYAGRARIGAGEFSEAGGRVVIRLAQFGSKA